MALKPPNIEDDLVTRMADVAIEAYVRALVGSRDAIRSIVCEALHTEFAGDRTYIAKRTTERNEIRDAQIRLEAKSKSEGGKGLSLRALGKKHHLSKSQVARIVRQEE